MLIDRRHTSRIALLSGLSAVGALASAAAALANRTLYVDRMPDAMIVGALGFDAMSLVVALTLVGTLWAIRTGRERLWMLWIGLQGYLVYAYALYAFDFVSTPMYLAYVAVLGLSVYALAVFVRALNTACRVWSASGSRSWHSGALGRRSARGDASSLDVRARELTG